MNRKDAMRINEQANQLAKVGFSWDEAEKLRLISKTLHSWCERECNGDIERDGISDKPYHFYEVQTRSGWQRKGYPVPDRETGALNRLKAILALHPGWDYYYQTDPRGAALYLVPAGSKNVESCYSSIGICIY